MYAHLFKKVKSEQFSIIFCTDYRNQTICKAVNRWNRNEMIKDDEMVRDRIGTIVLFSVISKVKKNRI